MRNVVPSVLTPMLLGLGCEPDFGFTIVPTRGVATVAIASWSGTESAAAVHVAPAGGEAVATQLVAGDEGTIEAMILGLFANTEYVGTLVDESGAVLATTTFETGQLPGGTPNWTVEGTPGWAGYLYFGSFSVNGTVYVTDATGAPVWAHVQTPGNIMRVRPTPDGGGVTYLFTYGLGKDGPDPEIVSVGWDGSERSRTTIEGITHDFVFLDDGAVAYPKIEWRSYAEYSQLVEGEGIVERTAEGMETTVWSSFDYWDPRTDGEVAADGDWTHANALDFDPELGVYGIGFNGMDAILRVERASGRVISQVGGLDSDYAFLDPTDQPDHQHQFQFTQEGVVVFDNRTAELGSRALELTLNDANMTATRRWEWTPAEPRWSTVLGDVHRTADGSTFIAFSGAGVLYDVAADGTERWSLSGGLGRIFGFVDRQSNLPGMALPAQ